MLSQELSKSRCCVLCFKVGSVGHLGLCSPSNLRLLAAFPPLQSFSLRLIPEFEEDLADIWHLCANVSSGHALCRAVNVGGWGEASLQGQSTPTGRSLRPVRACVRAVLFSVIHEGVVPFPFPFVPGSGSISLFPSGFVSWSLSEQI